MRCARSRGVTLVELLVALTLLGLVLGVSGLALASLRAPSEAVDISAMRHARAQAIETGTPRTAYGVLFLPDGRAVGAQVDPLTGAIHAR
jgi:prepilin-type N-terminal cleavage/methylation domain-containing protein